MAVAIVIFIGVIVFAVLYTGAEKTADYSAGSHDNSDNDESEDDNAEAEAALSDGLQIAYIIPGTENVYSQVLDKVYEDLSDEGYYEDWGLELSVSVDRFCVDEPESGVEQIADCIAMGYDGIVVAFPYDGMEAGIQAAYEAGIAIGVAGTAAPDCNFSVGCFSLAYDLGYTLGAYTIDSIGHEGDVVVLFDPWQEALCNGLYAALADYPNVTIIADYAAENTEGALYATDDMITAYGADVDAVITTNAFNALGVVEGLGAASLSGEIPVYTAGADQILYELLFGRSG